MTQSWQEPANAADTTALTSALFARRLRECGHVSSFVLPEFFLLVAFNLGLMLVCVNSLSVECKKDHRYQ
jgi:hypothetical protein